MDDEIELLLAERAIARVLYTYSRAADRFDLELMRSCYWPDGTDDHGSYNGGLDGIHARRARPRRHRFAHPRLTAEEGRKTTCPK